MKGLLPLFFIMFSSCILAQTTDASGRKQGYWKKKDNSGKVIYEGEFRDDKPVGTFRYYYLHDSVRAIVVFRKGGETAYATLFHPNGKKMAEGKYVNREVRDSVWTFFDESGILISRESYRRGKKNGPSYVYLPDGGLSEERNFSNGIEEGPFRQYFDGSAIKARGQYRNGLLEGRVSYHFPNGIEVAAGYYKNGVKNGPWIYRTEDGKVKDKELYEHGKLASEKETKAFFAGKEAKGKNN